MIAAAIADAMKMADIEVRAELIESDRQRAADLAKRLTGRTGWNVTVGTADDHLATAIARASALPCFVFLDPFGMNMGLDELTTAVSAHTGRIIELLALFHHNGAKRLIGHDDSPSGVKGVVDTAITVLGGTWWRDLVAEHGGVASPSFTRALVQGYCARLAMAVGGSWMAIPVRASSEGAPHYYLSFVTRNSMGIWVMNEQVSLAYAEQADHEMGATLFSAGELSKQELILRVRENVIRLLEEHPSGFRPLDHVEMLLDGVVGRARTTHVYQAIAALASDGFCEPVKSKDLPQAMIRLARR